MARALFGGFGRVDDVALAEVHRLAARVAALESEVAELRRERETDELTEMLALNEPETAAL